jgi:hypothetical protein
MVTLSVIRDSLTSSFLICIPFISFSCFISLAKNSSTIFTKSGGTGHHYLICDFRGNAFGFFPFRIMLAIALTYVAFIILRHEPSISTLFIDFIMKGFKILSKAFYASVEVIM